MLLSIKINEPIYLEVPALDMSQGWTTPLIRSVPGPQPCLVTTSKESDYTHTQEDTVPRLTILFLRPSSESACKLPNLVF